MPLVLRFKKRSETLTRVKKVNGRPAYTFASGSKIYHDGADWIVDRIGRSAASKALHPMSVRREEWTPTGISIVYTGKTSVDDPLCLERDLGVDFFFRSCQLPRPVWYRSPSGAVFHSGAKRQNNILGKRWCPVCRVDLSANNYKSQHLRLIHGTDPVESLDDTEWSLFCDYVDDTLMLSIIPNWIKTSAQRVVE